MASRAPFLASQKLPLSNSCIFQTPCPCWDSEMVRTWNVLCAIALFFKQTVMPNVRTVPKQHRQLVGKAQRGHMPPLQGHACRWHRQWLLRVLASSVPASSSFCGCLPRLRRHQSPMPNGEIFAKSSRRKQNNFLFFLNASQNATKTPGPANLLTGRSIPHSCSYMF